MHVEVFPILKQALVFLFRLDPKVAAAEGHSARRWSGKAKAKAGARKAAEGGGPAACAIRFLD